ncbi:hypothetical protein BG004_002162 [Podila humilis]|nr:hypothetical protein BG004_002162 [Podila humilis]
MSAATPTQEQIYVLFDNYNFDGDTTFQSGLKAILENNKERSVEEVEDAVKDAKFFYFSRFVQNFDRQQYLAWRAAGRSTGPEEQPTQESSLGQSSVDVTPAPVEAQSSSDSNPSYPKSFQEICELIASGKPIPGIRQIPNNLAEGTPSSPKLAPKRKPWERATAATSDSTAATLATEEISSP